MATLSPGDQSQLLYEWSVWARPSQLAPAGDWLVWLLLAGRGFGKSRTGAEWIRAEVEGKRRGRIALIARTAADARDVMVEGESGLLAVSPPWCKPIYEPSKRRLTWPNGAIATTYSAEQPDVLRGPQHDGAWADEIASWAYPETWDNLMFGLRLGKRPQVVATTTPRPVRLLRQLLADPTTATTRGSTYDNAENLPRSFLSQIIRKYEGTLIGRQELNAELLDELPGALWQRGVIESLRVRTVPPLRRIVVGVDPAATSKEGSDETGIVVAGVGDDEHGYVLADRSLRATPHGWARQVATAFAEFRADRIIAELNNGGEMVELTIKTVDPSLPIKGVHASRGKRTRAEPVAALYEQGRVHHVGTFPDLEDQMCSYTTDSDESPDRMDALVWALTELMVGETALPYGWLRQDPDWRASVLADA